MPRPCDKSRTNIPEIMKKLYRILFWLMGWRIVSRKRALQALDNLTDADGTRGGGAAHRERRNIEQSAKYAEAIACDNSHQCALSHGAH